MNFYKAEANKKKYFFESKNNRTAIYVLRDSYYPNAKFEIHSNFLNSNTLSGNFIYDNSMKIPFTIEKIY